MSVEAVGPDTHASWVTAGRLSTKALRAMPLGRCAASEEQTERSEQGQTEAAGLEVRRRAGKPVVCYLFVPPSALDS